MHVDRFGSGYQGKVARVYDGRVAEEDGMHPLGSRLMCAFYDFAGSKIAPHRVYRDWKHGLDQTSTAWRSLYHPHEPHTLWGSLVAPQRSQKLREERLSLQAAALRLRLLALEVFFLGTAIGCS